MSTINRQSVYEALYELASVNEQRRLWLSSGANGAEVSSFSEAVEQLYTDTGLSDALDCDRTGLSQGLNECLKKLKELLKTVNQQNGPSRTIDDPAMGAVRLLSNEIINAMDVESTRVRKTGRV